MALKKSLGSFAIFFLILVIAIFVRFFSIHIIPPGLYPDEAMNGVDALSALETGDFKVYYPGNNGREGLFMNIQAVAVSALGNEPWVLRSVSAVFGVLAVVGLFFLVSRMWNTRVALLASYLMAVGFWAVNFSRIGFRAIMLPAILVWSFYFLWVGLERKKPWAFLAAGLIFGVGMHSYISFRVAPIALVVFFAVLLVRKVYPRLQLVRWGAWFIVGAIIAASPILLYYAQNPADFFGRAAQVSVFEADSPLGAFVGTTAKTLGMFNFAGDHNWRHNFSGRPQLFWPVGIGFLVGMVLLVSRMWRKEAKAEQFLVIWFFVLLLPNFLSFEGAPHALRALGAQPAAYIASAIGLLWIYDKVQRWFSRAKELSKGRSAQVGRIQREIVVLSVLVLLAVGAWEMKTYFARWGFKQEVRLEFTDSLVFAGEYLSSVSSQNKYFIVNTPGTNIEGIPGQNSIRVGAMPVLFVAWQERGNIKFLNAEDISQIPERLSDATIVFAAPDESLSREFLRRYPGSTTFGTSILPGIHIP